MRLLAIALTLFFGLLSTSAAQARVSPAKPAIRSLSSSSGNSTFGRSTAPFGLFDNCVTAAPNRGTSAKDQALIERVTKWLEPHTKTLGREISAYHWTKQSALRLATDHVNDTPQPPGARAYIEARLAEGASKNPKCETMRATAGPGLYLAIDPVSTQGYGGDNPALLEFRIPAQTRTLVARRAGFSILTSGLSEILQTECGLSDMAIFFEFDHLLTQTKCRWLIRAALDRLNIGMIEYDYYASTLRGCIGNSRDSAFVLVSPKFAAADWKLITDHAPAPGNPDPLVENRAKLALIRNQTSSFPNDKVAPDEIQWLRQNLYQCGDHFEEIGISNQLNFAAAVRNQMLTRARNLSDDPKLLGDLWTFTHQEPADPGYIYLPQLSTKSLITELPRLFDCATAPDSFDHHLLQCIPETALTPNRVSRVERRECEFRNQAELADFKTGRIPALLREIDAILTDIKAQDLSEPTRLELWNRFVRRMADVLTLSDSPKKWTLAERAFGQFDANLRGTESWLRSRLPLSLFRSELTRVHNFATPTDKISLEHLVRGVFSSNVAYFYQFSDVPLEDLLNKSVYELQERKARQFLVKVKQANACLDRLEGKFFIKRTIAQEDACAFLR